MGRTPGGGGVRVISFQRDLVKIAITGGSLRQLPYKKQVDNKKSLLVMYEISSILQAPKERTEIFKP